VTSPYVVGPSIVDTIIAPDAAASSAGTAAAAISVDDQHGDPVSGVTITAVDTTYPQNSFTHLTGADGCLFVPQLKAPSTLNITISKPGYVSSTPTGTTAAVPLDKDSIAKPPFLYAPAAAIDFAGSLTEYPLATGVPVTWQVDVTGSTVHVGAIGTAVTGEWPSPSGFTAWAGDCADADPEVYGAARQPFDFVPGDQVQAVLDVRPVKLRGLPADTVVKVKHVGGTGCTTSLFTVGTTNAKGILKLSLPNGTWQATAAGETQPLGLLAPPPSGSTESVTLVSFTLANLDLPSPSPSGSGSPSPSPTVTP
jgi:hypothetical protein